jgi:hemolysin III
MTNHPASDASGALGGLPDGPPIPSAPAAPKPRFRGRLHQGAAFVAIPAGIVLVALARNATARVAAITYAVSLVGLYGVSAAYHRIRWSTRGHQWIKRADHSMIFVLIAGTLTPIALFGLDKPWSIVLLATVWVGAAAGIALKLTRVDGFRVTTGTLYIVLGWAVVLLTPQLVRGLSAAALSLVVAGGLLYTAGAIVLLRNAPDPVPNVFGYHEIWHSAVIAGSACHYIAVLLVLRPPIG